MIETETVRLLLIDPEVQALRCLVTEATGANYRELIGCDLLCAERIARDAILYADDAGRTRPDGCSHGFKIQGLRWPVRGRAVLVGLTDEGDDVDLPLPPWADARGPSDLVVRLFAPRVQFFPWTEEIERSAPAELHAGPLRSDAPATDGIAFAIVGTPQPQGVEAPFGVRRVTYRNGQRVADEPVYSNLSLAAAFAALQRCTGGAGVARTCMATPENPTVLEVWP